MGMALVVVVTIVLMLPAISYAFSIRPVSGFADGSVGSGFITRAGGSTTVIGTSNGRLTTTTISPNSNGYTVTLTTYNHNAKPITQTVLSVGPASKYSFTTYNTQTTIIKTYTQAVYYIDMIYTIVDKYMMPIWQLAPTFTNIGQLQAPGYHTIGNQLVFTPGSGGNGIFVPVYSQEAIYNFGTVLTVKPQVTGWYVGSVSQSTTTSTSVSKTPPQLSSIQETVNTIQQLATVTIPNVTSTTTNWVYSTSVFNNKTTVFILPTPYYYNDPNQNFALAWQSLTQGNIAGAAYYTGKGIYENLWNAGAWAVQQAFYFVSQASNAFNTATLAKAVAASIYGGVEGVGNALGQLFTKSWWSWP
jgi:hypothetical protein